MKLRRPRLKSVVGWVSALVGALLVAAAIVAHLHKPVIYPISGAPGPLPVNAFCVSRETTGFVHSIDSELEDVHGHHYYYLFDYTTEYSGIVYQAGVHRALSMPGFAVAYVQPVSTHKHNIYDHHLSASIHTIDVQFVARVAPHNWLIDASVVSIGIMLRVHAAWLWALGAPLLTGPAALRWRSRRRRRKGTCKRCGYDLAGLPAGAACPECGSRLSP